MSVSKYKKASTKDMRETKYRNATGFFKIYASDWDDEIDYSYLLATVYKPNKDLEMVYFKTTEKFEYRQRNSEGVFAEDMSREEFKIEMKKRNSKLYRTMYDN